MKRFLIILLCCLALLSCVSIAITQVAGDSNDTQQEDDADEINIGHNEDKE